MDLNPFSWFQESAEGFLYHEILPVVLVVFAALTLVFAPMRAFFKIIVVAVLVIVALWLWGYFEIPGVSV